MTPTKKKRDLEAASGNQQDLVEHHWKTRRMQYAPPGSAQIPHESDKHRRTTRAMCRVFNTVELAEKVLKNLACADLSRVLSVCRRFHATVEGSSILQEGLFSKSVSLGKPDRIINITTGTLTLRTPATLIARTRTSFWLSTPLLALPLPLTSSDSELIGHIVHLNTQAFSEVQHRVHKLLVKIPQPFDLFDLDGDAYGYAHCQACDVLTCLLHTSVALEPRVQHDRALVSQGSEAMERYITNPPVKSVQVVYINKIERGLCLSSEARTSWKAKVTINVRSGVQVKHVWQEVQAQQAIQDDDGWTWRILIRGGQLLPTRIPICAAGTRVFKCDYGKSEESPTGDDLSVFKHILAYGADFNKKIGP